MKLQKNKLSTALILVLAFAFLASLIPMTNAAIVEVDTTFFVMLSPDPVGVEQPVLVSLQIDKTNPLATGVALGDHFTGYMVNITKPDGTVETKGPFTAFATSGYIFFYTPTQTGTYKFKASFPGQWANTSSSYVTSATVPYAPDTQYYFKPSVSREVELTVQQEQIEPFPENPLPDGYWARPINAENKGWWQLADNWLMEGYDYHGRRFPGFTAFAPYTSAPSSAHVLWKRPLWFGGIGGGQFGDRSYYTGLSYEQPYVPMILQGRIIYSEHPPVSSARSSKFGTRCLDLYTGEEIWFLEDIVIDWAQVLSFDSPNEHGLIAHLWSQSGPSSNTTYRIYDGMTGNYLFTITNATGGQTTIGPNGEILNYAITGSGANRKLMIWNSTKAILDSGAGGTAPPRQDEYYSPPQGVVADGKFGIQTEVSLPDIPGSIKFLNLNENFFTTWQVDPTTFPFTFVEAAYNAQTGALLWNKNRTDIYGHYAPTRLPYAPSAARDGIRVIVDDSKSQLHAYDLQTGNERWVADYYVEGWSYFDQVVDIAYDKVYLAGYDGHIRAFDVANGNVAWDYFLGEAGYETAYGTWPVYAGFTIADHKLFVTNDDHSPDSVLWRGGKLYALNTDNGDEVWSISGWFRIPVIADGYLTAENSLDGQIYTFGKGQSETTVTVSPKVSSSGAAVLIEGNVLDQSPGQPGTPAISDEDMSAWMEYLHMQKPKPETAKGVPVSVVAIHENGNVEEIGTATSDLYGNFGISWTPPSQGLYQIVAEFAGSNSYGRSTASTYLNVGPAGAQPSPTGPTGSPGPTGSLTPSSPSPSEPEQPPGAPPTDLYIIAAIAIIVIIAAIAGAIILRRRK